MLFQSGTASELRGRVDTTAWLQSGCASNCTAVCGITALLLIPNCSSRPGASGCCWWGTCQRTACRPCQRWVCACAALQAATGWVCVCVSVPALQRRLDQAAVSQTRQPLLLALVSRGAAYPSPCTQHLHGYVEVAADLIFEVRPPVPCAVVSPCFAACLLSAACCASRVGLHASPAAHRTNLFGPFTPAPAPRSCTTTRWPAAAPS